MLPAFILEICQTKYQTNKNGIGIVRPEGDNSSVV